MSEFAIGPLGPATWDHFVHLAEKHNGVWNGCWCTWFHPACAEKGESPDGNRGYKERLVREGKATFCDCNSGPLVAAVVSNANWRVHPLDNPRPGGLLGLRSSV